MPRLLTALAAGLSLALVALPAAAHDSGPRHGKSWSHGHHAVPSPGYWRQGPPVVYAPARPYFHRDQHFRSKHYSYRGHHFVPPGHRYKHHNYGRYRSYGYSPFVIIIR